jgi:mannitol-1-phosphate 5-dehydrogenase
MSKNYCGFGMGTIQVGLFLWEAQQSGCFDRLSVVEVDEELIDRVRKNGGAVAFNIATQTGIKHAVISNVELLHPSKDYGLVLERLAEAHEIGSAIPSIELYGNGNEFSLATLLAKANKPISRRIVYCAENHNQAAETLAALVHQVSGTDFTSTTQFLNTVIGKMSGAIYNEPTILQMGLATLTPGLSKAILVEEFNDILIDAITLPNFSRGIKTFREVRELGPYQEAKLYAHNCIHAWMAYSGMAKGYTSMDQIGRDTVLMKLAHETMIGECGPGLIRKHGSIGGLFTEQGFREYGRNLLERMVNPNLCDSLERVGRNPERKLGAQDRLVGSAKLALAAGVIPNQIIEGIRLALQYNQLLKKHKSLSARELEVSLTKIWGRGASTPEEIKVLEII